MGAYCSTAALSNGHHDHHHDHHDEDHHEHHHEEDHDDHEELDHDHPHNHRLGDHLGQLLNKDQDHYHPSLKPDGQVIVDTMLKVRSIGPIDPKAKTLTLVLTHREKFIDSRLADEGRSEMATLVGKDCDLIWTPDTFFRSSVEEEVIGGIKPNCLARVWPNGDVLVSRRIKLKSLTKQENLQPPSTVTLGLASYGYTTDDVTYTGSAEGVTIGSMTQKTLAKMQMKVGQVSVKNADVKT